MFVENVFTVQLELAYSEKPNYKLWLDSHREEISNLKNGYVLSIIKYWVGPVIIKGFQNLALVDVKIHANVFLPRIDAVYIGTKVKSTENFSIYKIPHSLVYIAGKHVEETLKITPKMIRYENNQFLIVANLCNE